MFSDAEINDAAQRLAKSDNTHVVSLWAFPNEPSDYLSKKLCLVDSVNSFQRDIMIPLAHAILNRTAKGLTFSGLDNIPDSPTLFISNHRDIVLDAYFLQVILLENNIETSQIIAGTNLFVNPFVTDIAYCNKLVPIGRGGSKRAFGEEMIHISEHLRNTLTSADGGASVWIAQRNGRTKDRKDKTDPSIIHMLCTTGTIDAYNIVPVTITYEIEPNAVYKALYLYQQDHPDATSEENYMEQIIGSILQPKGHIHYSFHPRVDLTCHEVSHKEYYQLVAHRIDDAILSGYKHWEKNQDVEKQWENMLNSVPTHVRPYLHTFDPIYE